MVQEDATRAGWENLANAIVLSAVKDFRTEYKRYLKNPKSKDAANEVAELIRFFTSEYYSSLTSVDGEFLVRELKSEVEEKINAEKRRSS